MQPHEISNEFAELWERLPAAQAERAIARRAAALPVESWLREKIISDGILAAAYRAARRIIAASKGGHYDPNQPRDEDGKWTDGGGGDGGGGGGETISGYSPGVKNAPAFPAAKAVKQKWIEESPIKTMDDIMARAGPAQQALGDVGAQIAAKLGIEFKNPGSKVKKESGKARVEEKARLRGGNLAAVTDIARGAFTVEHPAQADAIIEEFGKHFEVAVEPWKLTSDNYGDRALNVRLPNGVIAEVQILEPRMAAAKSPDGGGGHDLYKIAREAAPNGSKPDPKAYADALAGMRALYGAVLDGYPPEWKAAFGIAGS